MSNNANTYLSCLKWIIHPPFISGQTMEAKFHHKMPSVAQWHVTLQSEKKLVGEWEIIFSLVFENRGDEHVEIVVNDLVVRIFLEEKFIVNENVPIYQFDEGNGYKYRLKTSGLMFAQITPCQMVVDIRMYLKEDSRRPPLPFHEDLKRLVIDLSNLSKVPRYQNVDLCAKGRIVFGAHSYILSVRWSDLFEWPQFRPTAKTEIKTDISSYLLRHILIYMYCGLFVRNFPHWDKPQYISELFQVIEDYRIRHLRDSLVKSDSSQLRESKKSVLTLSFVFRLYFVNDVPVNDASLSLISQDYGTTRDSQYHETDFDFQIKVTNVNRVGPWLSYSLRSKVNSWVYAQVNLEVLKMEMKGKNKREFVRPASVHANNYSIGPNGSIESEPVIFLGCLETFGDLTTNYPGKIQQWFRLNICLTDGTSLDEFRSFNTSRPSVLEKYNELINHMSHLLSQKVHADMRLISRCNSGYNDPTIRWVHKAILTTRIPLLHNVLDGFEQGNNLSEKEIVALSGDALPYVVEYIYTGKFVNVPQHLLEEISDFANRGNLTTLSDLINKIPKEL